MTITTQQLIELINKVEHSGDPHEDLNGKHIKDWQGKQMSIVDGQLFIDELDEEQMKAIRNRSISNGTGNIN